MRMVQKQGDTSASCMEKVGPQAHPLRHLTQRKRCPDPAAAGFFGFAIMRDWVGCPGAKRSDILPPGFTPPARRMPDGRASHIGEGMPADARMFPSRAGRPRPWSAGPDGQHAGAGRKG